MKLLMHTCCAPCSIYCISYLREHNIEPVVYWYNPNIHPYKEYEARKNCLKEYTKSIEVKAIFEDEYGLKDFCKNTINDLENRCTNYCYKVRLEKTVQYDINFLYIDFRTGFRQGQAKARELGLYMQKYCGCVFSEEARYYKRRN